MRWHRPLLFGIAACVAWASDASAQQEYRSVPGTGQQYQPRSVPGTGQQAFSGQGGYSVPGTGQQAYWPQNQGWGFGQGWGQTWGGQGWGGQGWGTQGQGWGGQGWGTQGYGQGWGQGTQAWGQYGQGYQQYSVPGTGQQAGGFGSVPGSGQQAGGFGGTYSVPGMGTPAGYPPLGPGQPRLGIFGTDIPGLGVRIESIEPGSPAERMGIEVSDVIVQINGRPIRNMNDLRYAVGTSGGYVRLLVLDNRTNSYMWHNGTLF